MKSIGIGALAKSAGVGIDTVRYYERNGLLAARSRLASGYRRYGRDLLGISAQRNVANAKRAAQAKLADIDQRIAALERMRKGLSTLIAACPGHGRAADCPILNALGGKESYELCS